MYWIIELFIHWTLLTFASVAVMAFTAHLLGIAVLKMSFGVGQPIYQRKWFQIGWIPLGGYVRMLSAEDAGPSEARRMMALDLAPAWKRVSIPLVSMAVMFLFSFAVLGFQAVEAFLSGFSQIFSGSLGPFSDAQSYLDSGVDYARTSSTLQLAAMTCTKLIALNLLPFTGLNGFNILMSLARGSIMSPAWESRLHNWLIWPVFFIWLSWGIAIGRYVWLNLA